MPARLLAQCLRTGDPTRLWLAWARESDGLVRIFARPFDVEGVPLTSEPRHVYSRQARLAALDLATFGSAQPPYAHALLQTPPREQLIYVRAALKGETPPQQLRIAEPPRPPSLWAVSG